ncbi:MAG: hypothetical protein K2X29_03880 [Candidatus Obscuribacterales bacterium]|nr:hypothetical protein [Candidatus Obscuribacterales bacterium]
MSGIETIKKTKPYGALARRAMLLSLTVMLALSGSSVCYADRLEDAKESGEYVVTMGDIRDVGLCLKQIKQQAVFIYLEATRKELPVNSPGKIVEPKALSVEGINFKDDYLPARREWLVFFIGSMEPIIRLMGNDVKDVQNGMYALSVPNISKEQFDKRWKEWTSTVTELNVALDKINDSLSSESGNNEVVASQAVVIFNGAKKLENLRMLVHHLMQEHHHLRKTANRS